MKAFIHANIRTGESSNVTTSPFLLVWRLDLSRWNGKFLQKYTLVTIVLLSVTFVIFEFETCSYFCIIVKRINLMPWINSKLHLTTSSLNASLNIRSISRTISLSAFAIRMKRKIWHRMSLSAYGNTGHSWTKIQSGLCFSPSPAIS